MQCGRGFPCFVEFLALTSVKKRASQRASQNTAYAGCKFLPSKAKGAKAYTG